MKKIVLILLLAFSTSCTAAQWQAFQQSSAALANYVSDAMIVINAVELVVNNLTTGQDRASFADLFEGIQAADEALQAEADIVRQSHTPLDTPAQIATAFPRFIDAWNHLSEALSERRRSANSAAPRPVMIPAIVRAARVTP